MSIEAIVRSEYGAPEDVLDLKEVDEPVVGDDEVLVRVRATTFSGDAWHLVRGLLTMQAHWDHTAALAEIKQITGAKMLATKDDARVLEDGGFSDAHFGGRESFKPVSVDQIIVEDEVIELGDTRLTVYEHPGHTEGSSSYSMRVRENGRDYNVVIANMGTINRRIRQRMT